MADIDIIATLRDAITSGQTYTQISTAVPLNQPLAPGVTILLGYASGTTQTLTVSASASAGSSQVAVNSFMASATFVPGTLIGNSGAAVLGAVTQGSPPWVVSGTDSTTGTPTSVAASASDVTILAANANRDMAVVFNDSASATLYLLLGAGTSSTTVYSVQVPPGGYFELPLISTGGVYTGVLKGIWSAAVGNARVTEFS